ncbi:MAG: hypothetical protein ABIS17_17155 [Casimicrobiaceae bacterium]
MDNIDDLERRIEALSTEDLASFRAWFADFDADRWDRQFQCDVASGKLDSLAKSARERHAGGRSTKL